MLYKAQDNAATSGKKTIIRRVSILYKTPFLNYLKFYFVINIFYIFNFITKNIIQYYYSIFLFNCGLIKKL